MNSDSELAVSCLGYVHTLGWFYPSLPADTSAYDARWILSQIADQTSWVANGIPVTLLESPTRGTLYQATVEDEDKQKTEPPVVVAFSRARTAWEVIENDIIPSLGGEWRLVVDNRRTLSLSKIDPEQPQLQLWDGELTSRFSRVLTGSRTARTVPPGWVEDLDLEMLRSSNVSGQGRSTFLLESIRVNPEGELDWSLIDEDVD